MKVLLANYRYFISGGPERYLFNLSNALSVRGQEVIPFSIKYSRNFETQYSNFFVDPLGSKDEVYFEQQKNSIRTISRTLSRLFYSPEVEKAVCRLIDVQKPQIAYVLHYLRKLSPSLLIGLKKKNLPIVVRLSDYAMICPQAYCLSDDIPCTLCVKGDLVPSVKNRCLKGSLPISLINLLATRFHRAKGYFDLIDTFVCTNRFMYQMMLEANCPENKLRCIPTFTNLEHFRPTVDYVKSDYIAYCGRLTNEKGLHVLIDAFALLQEKGFKGIRLKIAGSGDLDYITRCQEIVKKHAIVSKVEFLGNLASSRLPAFLSKALFSVIPSLWFENLPNVLLESYACGTPVIASDIGSLSFSVEDNYNGFLFQPGDSQDLAEKMAHCLGNNALLAAMALAARSEAEIKYSPSKHVDTLLQLFGELS